MNFYLYSAEKRNEYDKRLTTSDYTKFIILGSPRVGSTWILSALTSHPHVIGYSEIFDNVNFLDNLNGPLPYALYPYETINYFKKLREEDPAGFLDNYIYRKYHQKVKCVGFKFFYDQPEQEPCRSNVLKYLTSRNDIRIIHIKRKNLLENIVSLEIALKTNNWVKTPKSSDTEVQPFVLGYNKCLQLFEEREQQQQCFDALFKHFITYQLHYEDLARSPATHFLEIQRFLGLEPRELQTVLKKQNTKPLSDLLLNYEELKERFSSSKWAYCFEE